MVSTFDPRRRDNWRSTVLLVVFLVVVLAVAGWLISQSPDPQQMWVAAGALGALVAVAELVTRYRDEPASAILSLPGTAYLVVNIASSVSALYFITVFDWRFGATADTLRVTQVLVAGFGSAALFRSSLLNVTMGNEQLGIGPSAVLNIILKAADRAVDRERAWVRARRAASIMNGLGFEANAESMLLFTGASMQNLTDVEAKALENKVSTLRDKKVEGMPDQIKSFVLGLNLLNVTGWRTLAAIAHEVRAVQDAQAQQASSSDAAASTPSDPVAPGAEGSRELAVLDYVRKAGKPVRIREMQRELGLTYREVGEVVNRLITAGAIQSNGEADESVSLPA
jgi:hypothetical protein